MKLSGAQQRALDTMRKSPDGTVRAYAGVTRPTAEALERRGLVTVERRLAERQVRQRGGGVNRRTYVDWTARLKPVMPTEAQVAALDATVAAGPPVVLVPAQRHWAAAYAALTAPSIAFQGSPAADPSYDPAAVYVETLHKGDAYALAAFNAVRMMSGAVPMPPDPTAVNGPPTTVWTIREPGTPDRPGVERARVVGATRIYAAQAANSILNQRGGYDMRRLGANEIGPWLKDFRAGGTVLRLSAVDGGPPAYQVAEVATGDVMVIRATPEEAERDARADVDSLTSALATRPTITAERT